MFLQITRVDDLDLDRVLASFDADLQDVWLHRLDLKREAEISALLELCPIQDPFRFRSRYWGLQVANLLIDSHGGLQREALISLSQRLSQGFFSLSPRREGDLAIHTHVLSCLRALEKEPKVWDLLRKFSAPVCHKGAEKMIQETLWPEEIRSIQTVHVRKAVLAAWLTPLRQASGSCFATAPAILIQQRPAQFLKDLYDLLSLGQLKRTIEGKEYAVPLYSFQWSLELNRPIRFYEHLSTSPGLIAALGSARLISFRGSMKEKIDELRVVLGKVKEVKTIHHLLHQLILQDTGLTEQDVADEERIERILIQSAMAGGVVCQKQTARGGKVADWKKRLARGDLTFWSLTECSLLRAWEISIAGFCDAKTDFSKWNLYTSLGMHFEQKWGIAECLYRMIERMIQKCNQDGMKFQGQYEEALHAVHSLEFLLRKSSAQRYDVQGELAVAVEKVQSALDERDRCAARAAAWSESFSSLIDQYSAKFQMYFQEIFDPSVRDENSLLFEDSPAGFRLLYKHGRYDASTWTLVDCSEKYIDSLRLFFTALEEELVISPVLGRDAVSEITTELIQWIHQPVFLNEARQRSQAAGRNTPWDYVSGGTMQKLVQTYYSRSLALTETVFFPKSEGDLLSFLSSFPKDPGFLIQSPVHAFILRLDLLGEEALEKLSINQLTAQQWSWSEEEQEAIAFSFSEALPAKERALFLHLFRQQQTATAPIQLRQRFLEALQNMQLTKSYSDLMDAYLFQNAPLLNLEKAKIALRTILNSFSSLPKGRIESAISGLSLSFFGPFSLYETAKSIIFEATGVPVASVDWDGQIASQMRSLGYASPHLMLFAETNWSEWYFGFVFNLFTNQHEIWRLDRTGMRGFPMRDWKQWLSPENQRPWILLSRKEEYAASV